MTTLPARSRDSLQVPRSNSSFDEWWPLYPRKIAKADALKAFVRLDAGERLTLLEGTPMWAAYFAMREARFVPYPATFIRSGSWLEPPPMDESEPAGWAGIREMLGQ